MLVPTASRASRSPAPSAWNSKPTRAAGSGVRQDYDAHLPPDSTLPEQRTLSGAATRETCTCPEDVCAQIARERRTCFWSRVQHKHKTRVQWLQHPVTCHERHLPGVLSIGARSHSRWLAPALLTAEQLLTFSEWIIIRGAVLWRLRSSPILSGSRCALLDPRCRWRSAACSSGTMSIL